MKDFSSEINFKTSRSSGAGGQNVNKVETSVTSIWHLNNSSFFSDSEKMRIAAKLKNRINSDGFIQLTANNHRTQLANKKLATERLLFLVDKALFVPKKRVVTKPSKRQIQKRLDTKKKLSEKKENRKFRY